MCNHVNKRLKASVSIKLPLMPLLALYQVLFCVRKLLKLVAFPTIDLIIPNLPPCQDCGRKEQHTLHFVYLNVHLNQQNNSSIKYSDFNFFCRYIQKGVQRTHEAERLSVSIDLMKNISAKPRADQVNIYKRIASPFCLVAYHT